MISFFKSDMSAFIIDNTKDINLINKYCKYIQGVQDSSTSSGFFSINFYDIIARALYKIGKKKEAKIAQQKFEEIYTNKISEAKKYLEKNTEQKWIKNIKMLLINNEDS
jgi:hypothetical protein